MTNVIRAGKIGIDVGFDFGGVDFENGDVNSKVGVFTWNKEYKTSSAKTVLISISPFHVMITKYNIAV